MKIWTCKIGECDESELPDGADLPMRRAIQAAYAELTLTEPAFTFSGWGGELTEGERAVVENREPAAMHAENDNDLFATTDAAVWADRFVKRAHENPALATNSGAMLAWFAGAIETGRGFSRVPEGEK